ncbi:3612_t:CDS:2, partial [Gigaspora rosea]
QSIDISDNEWDSLFDTSQNVNNSDSKQDFDNDKGPNKRQNSDDKQDIQNPENPSTWNFNEQATLNEEITDDVEEIEQ